MTKMNFLVTSPWCLSDLVLVLQVVVVDTEALLLEALTDTMWGPNKAENSSGEWIQWWFGGDPQRRVRRVGKMSAIAKIKCQRSTNPQDARYLCWWPSFVVEYYFGPVYCGTCCTETETFSVWEPVYALIRSQKPGTTQNSPGHISQSFSRNAIRCGSSKIVCLTTLNRRPGKWEQAWNTVSRCSCEKEKPEKKFKDKQHCSAEIAMNSTDNATIDRPGFWEEDFRVLQPLWDLRFGYTLSLSPFTFFLLIWALPLLTASTFAEATTNWKRRHVSKPFEKRNITKSGNSVGSVPYIFRLQCLGISTTVSAPMSWHDAYALESVCGDTLKRKTNVEHKLLIVSPKR